MQSSATRCIRVGRLIFHNSNTMMMAMMNQSHHPRLLPSPPHPRLTTTYFSSLSHLSSHTQFFKGHNSFLSHTRPGSLPNASALLSTSSTPSDAHAAKTTVVLPSKVEPSEDKINNTKILATLAKSLWMEDNIEFRIRVLAALGFLIGAKVLNVQVPFLFKLAVDWLTTASGNAAGLSAFATANPTYLAVFATPAAVLIGYGIARVGASAFNEFRTAVFSKVALRTIRSVSRKVFSHLHELDFSYHLSQLKQERIPAASLIRSPMTNQ